MQLLHDNEAFDWETWPAYGQIVRSYTAYGFEQDPQLKEVSHVRALSKSECPASLETLSGATMRMAWLYGFAAAVKDKNQDLIKAFEKCACKVPVRFELLPNQDEVTVRKLQFDQDIKSKAEMQGLYGYKMAKIYAQVQQELTGKNLPSQYADVHRYLLRVAWTAADLPKLSSVATHLKVHSRLTEDSVEALDILESHYGKHHALANISSLDVVAGKTSAKEQGLQQRPGLEETCSFSGLSFSPFSLTGTKTFLMVMERESVVCLSWAGCGIGSLTGFLSSTCAGR